MISLQRHADDRSLELLVFGDEQSAAYRQAAAHVEHCAECQARLDRLTESAIWGRDVGDALRSTSADAARPDSLDRVADEAAAPTLDFLQQPTHPELLGRLGRYDIERVLGVGGMGIVLKAFDSELNRPVAIKVLARHLAHSGAARQRFSREAKAAAAVVNEHVVAIHNVEAERDVPYLVMQLVAGESLQARVDRQGPLPVKELLRIGIQAAAGLAAAHEQGVVHRDIKPANILLESGVERALLTDFGLARTVDDASLTHTGVVAGTPQYMSPEQAQGEPTDHRTDLYSLGSVLYFMATGRPPFRAERAMGVLHRICHDQQRPVYEVNPDIPDALSDIIDQLLEKSPARRPVSAAATRDALTRILAELQLGRARRRSWTRRFSRHSRRFASGLVGLGVAASVFLAGLWAASGWDWGTRPAPDAQRTAHSATPPAGPPQSPPSYDPPVEPPFGDVASESLALPAAEIEAATRGWLLNDRLFAETAQAVTAQLDALDAAARRSVFVRAPSRDFQRALEILETRLQTLGSDSVPQTLPSHSSGDQP